MLRVDACIPEDTFETTSINGRITPTGWRAPLPLDLNHRVATAAHRGSLRRILFNIPARIVRVVMEERRGRCL